MFTGVFARPSLAAPRPSQVTFPPIQTLFCGSTWAQKHSLLSGGGSNHINYLNLCKEDVCLLPVYLFKCFFTSVGTPAYLVYTFGYSSILHYLFHSSGWCSFGHHLFQMPGERVVHTAPSGLASLTRVSAVGTQVNSLSLSAPERSPFADVPEFLHPAIYVPVFGDYESSCYKHPARCLCEGWSWVLWDKCPPARCWAVPLGG